MAVKRKLRYGMVGGSLDSFIGPVHRRAIALEEGAVLVAGSFSSQGEKNQATGSFYELAADRIYSTYQEMAQAEGRREDGIDFVVIVTPNVTHHAIAKAFLEAGIHVVCEKPLCFTGKEAEELERLAGEKELMFAVTYTYTGYAMAKLAKELVEAGEIGALLNVNAEYLTDGLLSEIGEKSRELEKKGQEAGEGEGRIEATWRLNPAMAGLSNCVGDIGTHIESLVAYITGMHPRRLAAVLDTWGMTLDVNANILVEYENGAHGVYSCSRICAGHCNGLMVRIFGTEGSIEWKQEEPDILRLAKVGRPVQVYHRGAEYIKGLAAERNHFPAGHPEGITYAFANIYHAFLEDVRQCLTGCPPKKRGDYPTVSDGAAGVRFVEAAVQSGKNHSQWVSLG